MQRRLHALKRDRRAIRDNTSPCHSERYIISGVNGGSFLDEQLDHERLVADDRAMKGSVPVSILAVERAIPTSEQFADYVHIAEWCGDVQGAASFLDEEWQTRLDFYNFSL